MFDRMMRAALDAYYFFKVGSCSYKELYKLMELQNADKKRLNNFLKNKICELVKHAYHSVPFYREIYEKLGVDIGKFKRVEDLRKLPIVNKSMLRQAFPDRTVAVDYRSRAVYDKTSGSMGEPFEFFIDRYAAPLMQASYMLFNTWMGVGAHDRHVQIASPKPHTLKRILLNRTYGKTKISTLDIKRVNMRSIVERINRINPKYIEGYSASLANTARLVEDIGLELRCRPKAVIATSEDLTESYRKQIEEVFHSKVFNRYGSREFSGAVAQECNICKGLHVNTALCHLELVDEDSEQVGEGERGRILITDLNNKVMPFIRYDIGDSAIRGPERSECGRSLPLIDGLRGKEGLFIVSKTGEKTAFETVSSHLFQKYASQVYMYQFVQERRGELSLKIVATEKFDESVIEEMYAYLEETLVDFSLSIEVVDDIPPTETGKKPFIITLPDSRP